MENVSTRLQELFNEINTAVESLTEAVKRNPREIIAISKIIEKGEKRTSREYSKRIGELKTIQHEIEVITQFAAKMGYILVDGEPEEQEEQPITTLDKISSNAYDSIKVVIGGKTNGDNQIT